MSDRPDPRRPPLVAPETLRKLGLAAVILLAPGGFVLGTTLGLRYLNRQRLARADRQNTARPDDA